MRHRGFTLIELLLAVGVIGVVSSIVIVAVSPKKQLTDATDAERKHNARELTNALYANLIDKWEMAGGGSIPPCTEENKGTCAKPVCRAEVTDDACIALGGVSLRVLPPEYIAQIPVDTVIPGDEKCTGYMVYQDVGRPMVFAANIGKMPGDVPAGTCGTGPAVIATGLIGYWKFDDGAGTQATDSSGNGYDGTLADGIGTTAQGPTWSTEKPSTIKFPNTGSLQFDGVNDFVRLSTNAALRIHNYNDFTVTAWYKSADSTVGIEDQYVFGQYSGSGVPSEDWYLMSLSATDDAASPDSARFHLHQNPSGTCCTYGTKDVVDQQWHHLAIVRKIGATDATREVWIDGEKQGSTTHPNRDTLIVPRDGPTIGAEVKTPDGTPVNPATEHSLTHLAKGLIDDVRVYDRALSQSEIEQIAAGEG